MPLTRDNPDFHFPCDHICHEIGLNPWVRICPICRCANPKWNPQAEPDSELQSLFDELNPFRDIMEFLS